MQLKYKLWVLLQIKNMVSTTGVKMWLYEWKWQFPDDSLQQRKEIIKHNAATYLIIHVTPLW